MTTYEEFLASKRKVDAPTGLAELPELNPMLFDFQRDIVRWALRRGRACIWADCGLGKTPMQLEWAKHVPGDVLIVPPLGVTEQTIREGDKFGVPVVMSRDGTKKGPITITNYEQLEKFNPADYAGLVLDESSILKSYEGAFRTYIIDHWTHVPFRLACTATPAPNDYMELGNHAEFVGSMSRTEMLSMFFVHDGGETQAWRLKGHAEDDFWRWVCSWAVMVRKPSDLGYPDDGFTLPPLRIVEHVIPVDEDASADGLLFRLPAASLQDRQRERKLTTDARVAKAAELIGDDHEPWLLWCNLNDESQKLTAAIPGAVEVAGSHSNDEKASRMLAFSAGEIGRMVTKPKIAGFGMNWQHCHKVAFVGLSDSWEQYYQAIRRTWRFGQTHEVECHIITASTEGAVVANIKRKESDANRLAEGMVKHMQSYMEENVRGTSRQISDYREDTATGDGWTAMLGDSCERIKEIEDGSVGYTIFSPPFASLYTYSNSDRDMGNCADGDEFMSHFGQYLVPELYRVTMPGRLLSFHCMNLPTSKTRDGVIGVRDFRGDLIRLFESVGWIYHSEVCIWKDPVTAMQRTKALGLLHKQLCKDSAMSRQGIPDYLVTMRKPGTNPVPVAGGLREFVGDPATFQRTGNVSIDIWQRYASPVWMDIRPNRTLQKESAREEKDERHICPLQLDVIDRGLDLWSMPGDLVLSPFMGIGSEGVQSVARGRRFVGIELKESYWRQAVANLRNAERKQDDLFSFANDQQESKP